VITLRKKNNEWKKIDEEQEQSQEIDGPTQKDIDTHPELSHSDMVETFQQEKELHIPPKYIIFLNQPKITNVILGAAITLGLLYIAFGVMSLLSLLGIRLGWSFYLATSLLGWQGQAVTGLALVFIGTVMLWSVPYYLLNRVQNADSYLTIGTGLGVLFGVIYLLIIVADVITGLVTALADNTTISIITFFYFPIILALLTYPVFRALIIRHHVLLLDDMTDEEIEELNKVVEEQMFTHGRRGKRHMGRSSFKRKAWRKNKKDWKKRWKKYHWQDRKESYDKFWRKKADDEEEE
jgi:hypothetical protein